MDRDEVKFIPVGNTAAGVSEVENLFLNNFMMTDTSLHPDLDLLFASSSSGGETSGEFNRLASIMTTATHRNRRMFTRAFDSFKKETDAFNKKIDARFTKLEGEIENFKAVLSRCLGTQETASNVGAVDTDSNNTEIEASILSSPEPVLQIVLEDNNESTAVRNDIGGQQDEGNSFPNSNNVQRIQVQSNNNARVAKPRIPCKFCGKSCASSYVYIHQRYKCPQRGVQDQQMPSVPSPTVIPVTQNSQAVFGQGGIFYLLNPSSSGGHSGTV